MNALLVHERAYGTLTSYVRAGYLSEIDYGLRYENKSLFGVAASGKVLFAVSDRSDAPADLGCPSSGSCPVDSPTFWTSKSRPNVTTTVESFRELPECRTAIDAMPRGR